MGKYPQDLATGKSSHLKAKASFKTASHASHQVSSGFRWKDGLFPPEVPKRVSSTSEFLPGPRARLEVPPAIFNTWMLVRGRLTRTAW